MIGAAIRPVYSQMAGIWPRIGLRLACPWARRAGKARHVQPFDDKDDITLAGAYELMEFLILPSYHS